MSSQYIRLQTSVLRTYFFFLKLPHHLHSLPKMELLSRKKRLPNAHVPSTEITTATESAICPTRYSVGALAANHRHHRATEPMTSAIASQRTNRMGKNNETCGSRRSILLLMFPPQLSYVFGKSMGRNLPVRQAVNAASPTSRGAYLLYSSANTSASSADSTRISSYERTGTRSMCSSVP